jgi:energy-coupling factor transporter ATP-binding protein EcfA2
MLKKYSPKEAAKLLGVDRETLDRFEIKESSPQPQNDSESDPLDTRSPIKKLIDTIHPSNATIPNDGGRQSLDSRFDKTATFGRDIIIKKAADLVMNNQSVLFTGPTGIGKTHLLKVLATTIPNAILIDSPVPFKTLLLEIAEVVCPSTSFTARTPNAEILDTILSAETLVPPVILIDNLDRLKTSEEDTLKTLIDQFPVIAAIEKVPTRLKSIGWKFQEIELPPIDKDSSQAMISSLTQGHSMNPNDYAHLETKILNLANGNPMAIVELIHQLPESKKVTVDHIRKIDHEAGIIYRDWSWMLMALWALLVVSRFIALGTHSFEGYILAGVGTTTFVFFKYIVRLKRN